MFEYLAPIIANGTTFGKIGYAPWLPFYSFGVWVFICFTVGFALIIREARSVGFMCYSMGIGSVWSAVGVWGVYIGSTPHLSPVEVFTLWAVGLMLTFPATWFGLKFWERANRESSESTVELDKKGEKRR